ncbi:MAG: Adenosylcobinamide-phosphate synthase [Oscillospiraceae bacterium]|nr:Adenosylcobinamide-phosphate synthase [Oscillospiraceae bacterium]
MYILAAVTVGFLLDLLLGDPRWLPHPVVWMGKLISALEPPLRRVFPRTPRGERCAGLVMALVLPALSFLICCGVLWLLGLAHPLLRLAAESFWCFQLLAVKSLRDAAMEVYRALRAGDLPEARRRVSYIVGRDTGSLDADGVTRAAVETVAENTSDGSVAPLLFLFLGGAPLGMLYKAVNTMDSMIGYQNDRYRHFGTAAARLDDVLNFIPARLSGLLMAAVSPLLGFDGRGAFRIFLRDRKNHKSPNSAHTEAACAGALGIRLAGDASYFGMIVHKPTIGDPIRPITPEDIPFAVRLLYGTSAVCFVLCVLLRLLAVILLWGRNIICL